MIYLVLSAVCLALLYGVYRLALSRTTLHRFNRIMLLSIIGLSAILPAIRISAIGDRPLLHVQNSVKEDAFSGSKVDSPQLPAEWSEEAFAEYAPVEDIEAPAERADIRTSVTTGIKMVEVLIRMHWITIITYLYLMGVAFFMVRLLIGIIRAETLCRLGGRRMPDGSKLLVCDGQFQPTSWRHTIIISRSDYESDNSRMIIEHEQAHIHHRHSIDVMLAQMVCALQWFNPAAWALKRSLQEVHEYEADAAVLADGENERRYQICLVQAALGGRIGFVTSNFADCSTKKRITMMKRGQSSPFVCLRALLMLPVALVVILLASACKSDASKDSEKTSDVVLVTEEIVAQTEPADTAFLRKFGYGTYPDIRVKKLNNFVEVEWDGAIWISVDGENTFHPALLENVAQELERLKKEGTVEVAQPDMVFVAYANDEHLDVCQNIIKQLQNSYSDDKIIMIKSERKTVPPPPLPSSKYHIDYNLNYETDKWVKVRIDNRNTIYMDAYNVTRTLSSAQDINPTLEKLGIPGSIDSVAVEIKADNTICIKIPHIVKTFKTSAELKKELNVLYPDATDAVYWKLIFDVRCSSRVENEAREIFNEEPYKDRQVRIVNSYRIYPPNMTHQDSIDYIIFQKDDGDSGRKRHIKNMKWYNDNKDKDEFFRMGFVDGKLCVCKGNDPSKLQPIEFDQLVPYFKENCPDGNERSAIVLFEIVDTEGVPVTYIDQVLTKMEGWVTTFTKRLYLSPKHIE